MALFLGWGICGAFICGCLPYEAARTTQVAHNSSAPLACAAHPLLCAAHPSTPATSGPPLPGAGDPGARALPAGAAPPAIPQFPSTLTSLDLEADYPCVGGRAQTLADLEGPVRLERLRLHNVLSSHQARRCADGRGWDSLCAPARMQPADALHELNSLPNAPAPQVFPPALSTLTYLEIKSDSGVGIDGLSGAHVSMGHGLVCV